MTESDREIAYHFENIVGLVDKFATPGADPVIVFAKVSAAYMANMEFVRAQLGRKPETSKLN